MNDDNNFAIPVSKKVKKYRNLMKPNFVQPSRLHALKKGCECTTSRGVKFTNPFYGDALQKLSWGSKTFYQTCFIRQNEAFKRHKVCINGANLFNLTKFSSKPAIYVSELVKATPDAIGCAYSIIIRLKKGTKVFDYVRKHNFTRAENKLMEMTITNYEEFDTIYFCHHLTAAPLSYKRLHSITVGESSVRVEKKPPIMIIN